LQCIFQKLDVEVELEGFIHVDSDASVAIATADTGNLATT